MLRLPTNLATACVTLVTLGSAAPVCAQPQREPLLVDRGVADIDPHAASQRFIDPGIDAITNREQMFDLSTDKRASLDPHFDGEPRYLLEGAGFRAFLHQTDYWTITEEGNAFNRGFTDDADRVALVSPSSFFSLVPPEPPPFVEPELLPAQVDLRLDGTVEGHADEEDLALPESEETSFTGFEQLLIDANRPYTLEDPPPGAW
ncbi:hypothetical protein [Mucisphaera sp.]|uniref:hypothetical protein n=1 Tax=Mucisphaera sp. TaxID=2913024 RepID=UPI003D0BC99C